MKYTWDENKLALNLQNHKVHFADVERFEWESAIVEPDNRKDYGESRFCAYGVIDNRLHCLVFTPRNNAIRLISLRKANQKEVKRYALKN
ncbi:MAG: BrnT family toxin [Methylococcales bacterium]